jgi:hypothetical protein
MEARFPQAKEPNKVAKEICFEPRQHIYDKYFAHPKAGLNLQRTSLGQSLFQIGLSSDRDFLTLRSIGPLLLKLHLFHL